ncbi:myosin-6-like [Condylostylus longicornis]|uniref:myosin-6-like n=1 Tax=Condylostylus longicornis TaxID=2530218 RepID=UPI00244DB2DE|nr:myosin-6-like [Condylostylus longicornis]
MEVSASESQNKIEGAVGAAKAVQEELDVARDLLEKSQKQVAELTEQRDASMQELSEVLEKNGKIARDLQKAKSKLEKQKERRGSEAEALKKECEELRQQIERERAKNTEDSRLSELEAEKDILRKAIKDAEEKMEGYKAVDCENQKLLNNQSKRIEDLLKENSQLEQAQKEMTNSALLTKNEMKAEIDGLNEALRTKVQAEEDNTRKMEELAATNVQLEKRQKDSENEWVRTRDALQAEIERLQGALSAHDDGDNIRKMEELTATNVQLEKRQKDSENEWVRARDALQAEIERLQGALSAHDDGDNIRKMEELTATNVQLEKRQEEMVAREKEWTQTKTAMEAEMDDLKKMGRKTDTLEPDSRDDKIRELEKKVKVVEGQFQASKSKMQVVEYEKNEVSEKLKKIQEKLSLREREIEKQVADLKRELSERPSVEEKKAQEEEIKRLLDKLMGEEEANKKMLDELREAKKNAELVDVEKLGEQESGDMKAAYEELQKENAKLRSRLEIIAEKVRQKKARRESEAGTEEQGEKKQKKKKRRESIDEPGTSSHLSLPSLKKSPDDESTESPQRQRSSVEEERLDQSSTGIFSVFGFGGFEGTTTAGLTQLATKEEEEEKKEGSTGIFGRWF